MDVRLNGDLNTLELLKYPKDKPDGLDKILNVFYSTGLNDVSPEQNNMRLSYHYIMNNCLLTCGNCSGIHCFSIANGR